MQLLLVFTEGALLGFCQRVPHLATYPSFFTEHPSCPLGKGKDIDRPPYGICGLLSLVKSFCLLRRSPASPLSSYVVQPYWKTHSSGLHDQTTCNLIPFRPALHAHPWLDHTPVSPRGKHGFQVLCSGKRALNTTSDPDRSLSWELHPVPVSERPWQSP